ncbi:MAG: sulfite exporter TauE/SafE family protein [Proteobacteria bacterium]|nr:sulfite exporter TauE/SafE family protein [Pseudomonadota bacterium]
MSDLPLWPALAAATAEPRFLIALAIALLAGLVRGFTGFGSALIYMPLMSAVYGPQVAAPTLLLFDTLCSLPFALKVWSQATRREIVPVAFGGALFLPLGVAALIYVDVLILRWFIAGLVLVALAVLISGWRYHGRPTLAASFGAGAMAGFGAGSVQIAAPPLLVFWLGGQNSAATVRANIMVYFILEGSLSIAAYLFTGLFDRQVVTLAVLLGVPFAAAMTAGAWWFRGTSDVLYRRLAYIIIAFSGLASLPLFDTLR